MSTLGGSRGERNAKPKFAALDINKLYITSRGESFEPSTQKSTAPRKHGMQSLGKVPTARRPPANLPSLKAEVGNPGEQSGSWTNELNEGQYVSQSPNHSTEEVNKIPNLSISKNSTQRHTSSPNISKPGELSWNTNEFPSLDGTGSYGGGTTKSQLFQEHYSGTSQTNHQADIRSQLKAPCGQGTSIATEDLDGGGNFLGGLNSCQVTAGSSQSSPLPPQFRALLPPFMQRGSESVLLGNENEGGSLSPIPSQTSIFSTIPGMCNDSKNSSTAHNVTTNYNTDNRKMNSNGGNNCSSSSHKSNNNGEKISNVAVNTGTNVTIISSQFSKTQSSSLSTHSQQQQLNNRIGGGNSYSSIPSTRSGRVVRGGNGGSNNTSSEGGNDKTGGIAYDNSYQNANRRGGSNHLPRYANRGTSGGGVGNYNNTIGNLRSNGGNVIGSGEVGSPSGFNDENRNSHPPYGSSVLAEQEVVVRPIIRDEELQRLEAIAKDEGWAKDSEFDYNQKLEFSDDESELNQVPTAMKVKDMATDINIISVKAEKEQQEHEIFDKSDRTLDVSVAHRERDPNQDSMQINCSSGVRSLVGEGSAINVNMTAGGLDAAEAKERLKQRQEEDLKRDIERKLAAARKLQELEEKLSRKKTEESIDAKAGNNDISKSGNIASTINISTTLGNKLEEEKVFEPVSEHNNERVISVKIRGKSGERTNLKDARYEFGTGSRHDRETGNISGSTSSNWDMPGFSKTFQSNLPPRFQRRKLERNTSGANLLTSNNNSVGLVSPRIGNTGPCGSNSVGEIKSGIPFAQQYDPRFIHNQQTYGKICNAMTSSSRRTAVSIRDRDERQRHHYDAVEHNQREVIKTKKESFEDGNRFNNATGGTQELNSYVNSKQNIGCVTPQLDRNLSESSNRKTSVSSDDNHHTSQPHHKPVIRNVGSNTKVSGNYVREKSWDMEDQKESSASSSASFSGSDVHRETPPRSDCDLPKQILHRVKETTPQSSSDSIKDEKMSFKQRIKKTVDCESNQNDEEIHRCEHLSFDSATIEDNSVGSSNTSLDPEDSSPGAMDKASLLSRSDGYACFGIGETNEKENVELNQLECPKDTTHETSHLSRSLGYTDDNKQITSTTISHQPHQNSLKKKDATTTQHSRDSRRHDSRSGVRGGGGYGVGFHRADGTGCMSSRGGSLNWNRPRGGSRTGGAGRGYHQDCWSESEYSEESFDEQTKHHVHQKIYNHSMSVTVGIHSAANADSTIFGGAKEGFVPRGEPSRRGRGGGNIGSIVSVVNPSSANNRQKQQGVFSGSITSIEESVAISKKVDGYGCTNSKNPFSSSTVDDDDRQTKHSVVDHSNSTVTSVISPIRDDRTVQHNKRPLSLCDAYNTSDDVLSLEKENPISKILEREHSAIDIRNDESHSREDSHKSDGRSNSTDHCLAVMKQTSDECDSNKSTAASLVDDTKTNTTKNGSTTTLQQQSTNLSTISGSVGKLNNSMDSNVRGKAIVGNFRGGSINVITLRQQQSVSQSQGGGKSSTTEASSDSLVSVNTSNSNQLITTSNSNNDNDSMPSGTSGTRSSTLSVEGDIKCVTDQRHLTQQGVTEKLNASSTVSSNTDNDKHHLDGNNAPVNTTMIFDNTNFKSAVSALSVNNTNTVGDCGGTGVDASITNLKRQQSGNSVINVDSKVKSGLMNEKVITGASNAVGSIMKSPQSLTSNTSAHRPTTSIPVTTSSEGSSQHSIVGNSQRTVLSAGVTKQQSSTIITSTLQGIPFQKSETDYKEVKPFAFETDISHLIEGDKGIKQQSTVSAGLCLSKSIEVDGGNGHGRVSASVQNIISPSTADLNMKIASVKKVWEMPTVPEQTGSGTVNSGGGGSATCNVNMANEHSVSGSGNVPSGNNVHLKSNFVRTQHTSHQPQYQHSHAGTAGHHSHQAHGTHSSYGAAFGSESDSLVEHFNSSNNVCNIPNPTGSNNGCDINTGITLNNECNDPSNQGYGLSHHHSQQQPTKVHQQTHQLQQQHPHQQQDLHHQRQAHNMQESAQSTTQQHTQQPQKQLQHSSQHSLQHHSQQLQRQQQQHKEQSQHIQQLQQMHQQSQQQHKQQTQSQSQSHPPTQPPSQSLPQSQAQTSQSQLKVQHSPQQQSQQLSQQIPQQLSQSQSQHSHSHQQHQPHKQSQIQQQLQQHPAQQLPQQLQQTHHQQTLQLQHQQQTQQTQHVSSVNVQQHQAAVAVTMGLNKHPVADVLAAAVAANNVNVCKVKPTQQSSAGGMHQSNSMGLSPPPQMQSGSIPSAPQPFYPAQYGVSAVPSPPAVLYNSAAAAAAMNSQGGLYNAFQIEPSGRSQFSQFPGHYGTSGTTGGPYNTYMTPTATNMQTGPTPEMFQSLSSQFRMGSVQSPYNQTTQMGNPNTMLISSNNTSLMSSSVKTSTQQIGAIGQPKPNGGGSVNQPPFGQQYLNMFPPAPLQNTAANYYSNSGGGQNAFFGAASATGAATQSAYGIPPAAVAASNMFGGHGGQNPSNTSQPPPPQQQMPNYSSQFLNSPLLAATNPTLGQQQYRGAPNNASQHSGANSSSYIKSNQSPQSSHIQQQQQAQQQQDTVSYYSFYHK